MFENIIQPTIITKFHCQTLYIFFSKEKLINVMEIPCPKTGCCLYGSIQEIKITFIKYWYPHTQCLEDLTKLIDMYTAQNISIKYILGCNFKNNEYTTHKIL